MSKLEIIGRPVHSEITGVALSRRAEVFDADMTHLWSVMGVQTPTRIDSGVTWNQIGGGGLGAGNSYGQLQATVGGVPSVGMGVEWDLATPAVDEATIIGFYSGFVNGPNIGNPTFTVDGVVLPEINAYNTGYDELGVFADLKSGTYALPNQSTPKKRTIRMQITGKHASSTSYYVLCSFISLYAIYPN